MLIGLSNTGTGHPDQLPTLMWIPSLPLRAGKWGGREGGRRLERSTECQALHQIPYIFLLETGPAPRPGDNNGLWWSTHTLRGWTQNWQCVDCLQIRLLSSHGRSALLSLGRERSGEKKVLLVLHRSLLTVTKAGTKGCVSVSQAAGNQRKNLAGPGSYTVQVSLSVKITMARKGFSPISEKGGLASGMGSMVLIQKTG